MLRTYFDTQQKNSSDQDFWREKMSEKLDGASNISRYSDRMERELMDGFVEREYVLIDGGRKEPTGGNRKRDRLF